MEKQNEHYRKYDIIKTLIIVAGSTAIGYLFEKLGFISANIITVYLLGMLIISVFTRGWLCNLIGAISSVLAFNYFFTSPKFTFLVYDRGYPITFLIMFSSGVLTGTLMSKIRKQSKEMEKANLHAKSEQLRADLLRSISHDLRTPLTSMSGNASNLLYNSEGMDLETKKLIYKDLYDDSMWLINIVENLLAVTRIENGQMKLNISTEVLDEIISAALTHVVRMDDEHCVENITQDDLILVMADSRLIIQVLVNLVDNAIKYTKKGSKIIIESGIVGEMAQIRVIDDGEGIAKENVPHIFDMFYTAENKVVDSRRSMGLGLYLCKAIVMAHHGTISYSDNVPHGSIFTITLPLGKVDVHE